MARKPKRQKLEELEQSREGRGYLSGFVVGYCLGRREALQELHAVQNDIETRAEDVFDSVRAEAMRLVAQFRAEWGLPELPDPDRRRETMQ